MIKLLLTLIQRSIESQLAIKQAMEASTKANIAATRSHTSANMYYDNLINHNLMVQEREIAYWDQKLNDQKNESKAS